MARSREYWEERFADLEEAQSERGAEYFAELEKQYKRASASVQRDIERWYARFAINNEITLQEARKLLTGNDLEEFRWNVMEYIEKGRTLNISDQWARQLENASARVHISRLEAIKLQMQNHVEVLYGNEMDEFSEVMREIYTEGYYHTAYEIQKGFNIGYDLMRLDTNKVEKVLSKPWAADGSNFSDRIWKQKSQLVSELHNNLTQAIMRGQNPHAVTEAIAKRFNVSRGQAGRLVMTESAFFNSASNRDCYKDLGVEQFEILATLDKHTSDICQSLDGKVFPMSEYAIGVTAPPFHVWCRTTTVPFFDDEFELGSERAARGEDGKTYYVPSDMKYEDWKNAFVDGGSKDGLDIIGTDRVRSSVQKMNDGFTEDDLEEWTPRKTSSMKRDPAKFRNSAESNGVPEVVEDMDVFEEDIDVFKAATTKDEAIEFARTLTNYDDFTVDGLHLNTVNGFDEAMYNVHQRFGRRLNISGIKSVNSADAKYHQGSFDPSTHIVSLKGGNSANALSTYKKNAEKFFSNGWNASNDVYGTFYHEIGHAVWSDLPSSAKAKIREIYSTARHNAYETWMELGGSYSGYSQAEIFGRELSRYALENEQEFFSEAFSQIMSGRMKQVSRQVNAVLNEYYKIENTVEDIVEETIEEAVEEVVEEITKITKKVYNGDYGIVDRQLVNSKAFHDKFEELLSHKSVNESIYREAMEMLEHRDNTPFEDLIVIDSRNGKVIARFTESTVPGKISLTAEQVDEILNYDGNVILLHNHPNSSRASYTDIRNLRTANVDGVIAVGHDGSVYLVTDLDSEFNIDIFWEEGYNSYKKIYRDEILANHHATDDLYKLGVFKAERR